MARPRIRGTRWSLNQVAAEAGVSRGITRAALAEGWLPEAGPYAETDIVLLRLADAWMRVFPEHKGPSSSALADTAKNLTSAAVLDPRSPSSTVVVASPLHVRTVAEPAGVSDVVHAAGEQLVVVFPVGAWRAVLPSQRRAALLSTPSGDFPSRDHGTTTTDSAPLASPPPHMVSADSENELPFTAPTPADEGTLPTPRPKSVSTPGRRDAPSPTPEGMTAYQTFLHARDAIVSKAHAQHTPQPYDSPGEPW